MSKRPSRGVTSGVGAPIKMQGRDGDLTIRRTKEGKILYIKEHGQWHPINTGIDIAQLKKDVDRLIRSVNISSQHNPNPFVKTLRFDISKAIDANLMQRGELNFHSTANAFYLHGKGLVVDAFTTGSSGDEGTLAVLSHTEDSVLKFYDGSTIKWTMGYDQSDSNKFKIHNATTLADTSKFMLDTSGNLTIAGDLTQGSHLSLTSTSGETTTMSVADTTGAFTIATTGDGTTDSDLTLDVDGDISMDAAGGDVKIT